MSLLLDEDAGLASSGCVVALRALLLLLQSPPPELARRVVTLPDGARVPYTDTSAYFAEATNALCASPLLSAHRMTPVGLMGRRTWLATAAAHGEAHPRLRELCGRLLDAHSHAVAALRAGAEPEAACNAVAASGGVGRPVGVLRHLLRDPAALWSLLPFLVIAVALPFVLAAPFRFHHRPPAAKAATK